MTQPEQHSAHTPVPRSASVAWLAERAGVADDLKVLAVTAADGGAFVQSLVDNGKPAEALQVIAAALPPREGVWWAWVSARHASQATTPAAPITAALTAVERWISEPDDERRRAAWAAGERAGLETAAGCAAAAVFFTSGSVAPAGVSPVPPPAGIDRKLAGNAVTLAAATNPAHFEALAGAYIAQGLEVVKQLGGWDKAVAISQEHFQAQQDRQLRASTPPQSDASAGQRPPR